MVLIHQLSKQSNIPIHTIRYYENYGLFTGKKDETTKSNNYTYYDDEVIEKLDLIVNAKQIGFTLAEIKEIIEAWFGKKLTIEMKVQILKNKQLEIDHKINHLKQMKILLNQGIKDIKKFDC